MTHSKHGSIHAYAKTHTHARANAMKHVDIAKNSSVDGIFIATTYANKRTKGKTTREQAQVPRTPEDRVMGRELEGVAIIYSVRVGGVFGTVATALALPQPTSSTLSLGGKGVSHRRCAQLARKCVYASVAVILPPAVRGQCLRWTCRAQHTKTKHGHTLPRYT